MISPHRIATVADIMADDSEPVLARHRVIARHGRWTVYADGCTTWTVCPQCEALIGLHGDGLDDDVIREHRLLSCAGDLMTSGARSLGLYDTY